MDCYKSSNNNSSKKTVELPISAPLFEGHLYLRQEGKWLWRMFRFDGTTLTCLSEKKFKLPPSTPLHRLPGTESCTSLLLATPKDKNVRITQSIPTFQTQPPQVSYYQLPKWTVDMVNVSSISILKHDDNNNNNNSNSNSHSSKLRSAFLLSPSSSKKSKTFCIRTFQGERLVMRAHKHQDLERWLFVLTKMWKFAQSIRQLGAQIVTNEATLNKKIPNDGDHHHMMYHNYYSSDNNIINNNNNSSSNNPPLFLERKMRNGGGGGGEEEEVVVVVGNEGVPPQMSNGSQNDRSYPLPPPPPQPQQHPILPEEKVNWIRAWAQSLGELSVYDEEIKSEPSLKEEENLLESYPVQPKAYPLDSNQYLVAHHNNRQRRSKPHMYANHNTMMNEETSFGFPCTHYFQDTNTEEDDESNHASNNRNDVLLTYHSSIKGKNIKFGSTGALNTMIKDDSVKAENPIPALFEFNKLSIDSSPLEKLGAYPKQQHKRNTHSFQPSIRPYHCNKRASVYMNHEDPGDSDDDDENMSLAEVKQFLKDKYTQPQTPFTNTTVH